MKHLKVLTWMQLYCILVVTPLVLNQSFAQQTSDENFTPMPLPNMITPLLYGSTEGSENYLIQYSFDSSAYSILKKQENFPLVQFYKPKKRPLAPVKRFSELQEVANPSRAPYRRVVKLLITTNDGRRLSCSGTLISPTHVVTACHCVFNDRYGGWMRNISVVPAYDDGSAPYGSANMEEALTWSAWIERGDYAWDVAVLKLDRPIGSETGWFNLGYEERSSDYLRNTYKMFSYPGTSPFNGRKMYEWEGGFDYTFGRSLVYSQDQGYGGQSGSTPFTYADDDNGEVLAVLSHGVFGSSPSVGYVLIDEFKYNSIMEWMDVEEEQQLYDIAFYDLELSTNEAVRGSRLPDFDLQLENTCQQVFSDSVKLSLFLEDPITKERRVLMEENVDYGSIQPRDIIEVSFRKNDCYIPVELANGTYNLGANIMVDDDILENNLLSRDKWSTLVVSSKAEPDPRPIIVSPDFIEAEAEGGTFKITLETPDNIFWSTSSKDDWLNVLEIISNGDGKYTLNLEVAPNNSTDLRIGTLFIQGGNQQLEITIEQAGQELSYMDTVILYPGWNIISIDLIPQDSSVEAVIASLKPGNLRMLQGLVDQTYVSYVPGRNSNDLKHFRKGHGYWINVSEKDLLIIEGVPIQSDFRLPIEGKRNLVAYIPQNSTSVESYFKDLIDEGRLDYVATYQAGRYIKFDPDFDVNSLTTIENGAGYWVELNTTSAFSASQSLDIKQKESIKYPIEPTITILNTNSVQLNYQSQKLQSGFITLIDVSGRTIAQEKIQLIKGLNEFLLEIPNSRTSQVIFLQLRIEGEPLITRPILLE
ncbi:MAG: trypsin-like serine protease [Bacteroidota bacterium]